MLPPGRARLGTKPPRTGSLTAANTIGMVWVACDSGVKEAVAPATITSGCHSTSSAAYARARSTSPPGQRTSILTLWPSGPASLRKPLFKARNPDLPSGISLQGGGQKTDPPHPLGLLRARRERPRSGRAAKKDDEVAPSHADCPSRAKP